MHLNSRSLSVGHNWLNAWTPKLKPVINESCFVRDSQQNSKCMSSSWLISTYRRIFVYTFCLINASLEIWAQYTEWFRRNSLLKTQMYGSLTFSPHSNFALFMADISFNIACKELKIEQIFQLNRLFQLLHLVHIYGHSFYELSRMLMRKNVNNGVSKDQPLISVKLLH